MDRLRIVTMRLTLTSHLVFAHAVQSEVCIQSQRIKSFAVAFIHISGDILNGDSTYTADCSGEIQERA